MNSIQSLWSRAAVVAVLLIQGATAGGVSWTHDLTAYGYDPRSASIGNFGTEVFVQFQGMSAHARLLSGLDSGNASPVWNGTDIYQVDGARTASASETSLHASVTQERPSFNGTPAVVLRVYRSAGSAPVWSYTFPYDASNSTSVGVHVAPDGSRVMAWMFDWWTHTTKLAAFSGSGGSPLYTTSIDTYLAPFGSTLSADGSTLFLTTTNFAVMVDGASGAILAQLLENTSNLPLRAVSASGTYCAGQGVDGQLKVWKRQGGTFVSLFTRTPAMLAGLPTALDFTGEESSLAVALASGNSAAPLRVDMFDLLGPSHGVVQSLPLSSSSTQSRVLDLAFAPSPSSSLLVATTGDATNMLPEIVEFASTPSGWTVSNTRELPQPAADLQSCSSDGRIAILGYGYNTAAPFQAGREITLWDASQRDLRCIGVPHAGATLTVQLSVPPQSSATMLRSDTLASPPVDFPSVGVLHLQPGTIHMAGNGVADDSGTVTYLVTLPTGAGAVGTNLNLQGIRRSPRRLSHDFVHVTVLP